MSKRFILRRKEPDLDRPGLRVLFASSRRLSTLDFVRHTRPGVVVFPLSGVSIEAIQKACMVVYFVRASLRYGSTHNFTSLSSSSGEIRGFVKRLYTHIGEPMGYATSWRSIYCASDLGDLSLPPCSFIPDEGENVP